tara:strand:+ start:83 stop:832 length:750 start_codon:yes stop_codon:yes gene_type:complete
MNVLELFSGTGSVGKVCENLGWNVVSVDMILPATHECDIMDFDYKQYPKDYFSICWGSPPCTDYSKLQDSFIGRKRKGVIYTKEIQEKEMDESDKLVLKTLEIIDYFKPELWCMENPQTGRLKERDIMKGIPFYDVDYCMYSDWGYRKRTRIWTNKKDWKNLMCDGSGACGNMIELPTNGAKRHDTGKPLKCSTRKLHINNLGKTETSQAIRKVHQNNLGNRQRPGGVSLSQKDKYRVPEDLIFSLFLD